MRGDTGIIANGFTAIFDRENKTLTDIRPHDLETYDYLQAYKSWELDGFTEKALEFNPELNDLEEITKTSVREVFDNSKK